MTIEYGDEAGDMWGIYIVPKATGEVRDPINIFWQGPTPKTFKWEKWGQGIYVYYHPLLAVSRGSRAEGAREVSGFLHRFLDDAKKSFTAEELRDAADQFFQAHPDFDGVVPPDQWPSIFKHRIKAIGRPGFVMVSADRNGKKSMTIEYAGSFFQVGVYIMPKDDAEIQSDLRTKYLKWEQGIYVYYSP